ncbi:MAG TPA: hypothetical protein VN777_07065 [Terriglobales bacterium]|nr:hypothetical protein [Terriglobales bacterium]
MKPLLCCLHTWLSSFQRCDLSLDIIRWRVGRDLYGAYLRFQVADSLSFPTRRSGYGWRPFGPQSPSHEIVNTAGCHLNLAFLSEDLGDVEVRPTATAEFTDEFAIRLQAGARQFFG